MGWTFHNGASRADIIAELTDERITEGRVFRTLRKCLRGNTMYALHETGPADGELRKWICVYLLQRDPGYGWGYKDIDESMGPVECDCPVSYLDQADPATHKYAIEWRAKIRSIASKRPKVGERWELKSGCVVNEVTITSLRPLRGASSGTVYKLSKELLASRMLEGTA